MHERLALYETQPGVPLFKMLIICPLTDLCGESGFQCPDGTCLSAEDRCDGQVHCSDGSDEPITCGR